MELSNEDLRKLQLVEYDLLSEVDRVCRKNGINYTLYAGSLLGAVRHKGFIPWDDDADVAFMPEEYDKFFEACKTDLNTDKFFLQDYRTDKYYRWGYGKLRRKDSAFIRDGQEHMKYDNGICIDVFTLHYLPDNMTLRKLYFALFFVIRKTLYSEVGKLSAEKAALRHFYSVLSRIPKETVFRFAESLRIKHPTGVVHHLYFPTKRTKYGIPREVFDEYTELEFEGKPFMAIKEYDRYLTLSYGDYHKLPPEEKRASHNPATRIIFPED